MQPLSCAYESLSPVAVSRARAYGLRRAGWLAISAVCMLGGARGLLQ